MAPGRLACGFGTGATARWLFGKDALSLRQTDTEQRGGMTFREFEIVYPNRRLDLTTYTYPDGKLEQYLVAPAN